MEECRRDSTTTLLHCFLHSSIEVWSKTIAELCELSKPKKYQKKHTPMIHCQPHQDLIHCCSVNQLPFTLNSVPLQKAYINSQRHHASLTQAPLTGYYFSLTHPLLLYLYISVLFCEQQTHTNTYKQRHIKKHSLFCYHCCCCLLVIWVLLGTRTITITTMMIMMLRSIIMGWISRSREDSRRNWRRVWRKLCFLMIPSGSSRTRRNRWGGCWKGCNTSSLSLSGFQRILGVSFALTSSQV